MNRGRRRFLAACTTQLVALPLLIGGCFDSKDDDGSIVGATGSDLAAILALYFGTGLKDAKAIATVWANAREPSWDDFWIRDQAKATLDLIPGDLAHELVVTDLRDAVQQDFLALRTTDVAGWTLANTEIALCLLSLLTHPGQPSPRSTR